LGDIGNLLDEFLIGSGVVLLLWGVHALRKTRRFISRCLTTEGTIVRFTVSDDDESLFYYATVTFTDADGVEHERQPGNGLQRPPQIGSSVSITYDPTNPSNSWITGSAAPWVVPWFIVVAGCATIIGGFALRAAG
jgi:hypothetical protein